MVSVVKMGSLTSWHVDDNLSFRVISVPPSTGSVNKSTRKYYGVQSLIISLKPSLEKLPTRTAAIIEGGGVKNQVIR